MTVYTDLKAVVRWTCPDGSSISSTTYGAPAEVRQTCKRLLARAREGRRESLAGIEVRDGDCGALVARWSPAEGWTTPPPAPPPAARLDAPEGVMALSALLLEDVAAWPLSRLGWWAHRLPMLLVSALQPGAPMDGLPRSQGAYTESEIADASSLWVAMEAGADGGAWSALAGWGLRRLFPEWRKRRGKDHACEERVRWLVSADEVQDYRP
jgi:hypothetical protein